MSDQPNSPRDVVRPLIRVRQIRDYTPQPVAEEVLDLLVDVARWSGSSQNEQPWRFITIRDERTLRAIHAAGLPQTRSFETAQAAIAIVLPDDRSRAISRAYDEGRAAERILVAASFLGLGAAIAWIMPPVLPAVRELLAIPDDRLVRTIVALGHPTEAAKQPKAAPGTARLPREQTVFAERFPPEHEE
jgi:nitroreductase